ncbi:MAG: Ig-like domain-containing protein, partial [Ilumatobacteraceae bacterium]
MSAVLPPDCAPRTSRGDRGFTLIELMIAIVLSLMIGGVVVAALITSLNAARSTSAQMSDSTDAGLVSSFLVRDAQSAGGIDPGTAMRDPTLGVSNLASPADWGGCAQSGVFVLRFSWMDRTAAATSVVTYAGVPDPLDGTKQQLIRRLCTNGTQADVVLGRDINVNPLSTFATCQNPDLSSGCGSQSTSVTLTLTGKNVPTPLVSVLTASLRSTASQLTIIGPPSLPGGQVGASYASVFLTTIGGSTVTAAGASVDPKWAAIGLPNGLSIAPSTDKSAGVISGTPIAGAVGHYTVTITVTDALGAKASKVYTIDVHAPPVAGVEVYSTPEDVTLTVPAPGVLANDTSPENKPLTAILYSGVANGSLTFASNGGFTYTPRPNFNGADSFKYKANDGSLNSSIVTVTLTVSAVNDPPVNRVPVGQETPKNTNEVFAGSAFISITDVDAGVLPVKVQLNATNGTVALPAKTGLTFSVGNGTAAATMTFTGTIANINLSLVGATFAPTSNFVGPASLQIVTNDQGNTGSGGALSKTDAVTINVTSLGIFTASQDVGNVKLTGSSSSASSTAYTVSGSGKDIWENNFDGFQFIYRPMTGDGSLTARIASEDVTYNGVHNPTLLCWAADNSHQQPCISVSKSEVMFRQDLTNVSAMHASVGMTQGNGSEYIYRTTVGASTGAASPGDSLNFPYWVRLTRRGDQLIAAISPDGVNWTQRGSPQTIAMGSPVYVGLASSAVYQLDTPTNQNTKRNTTQFDNVSISTPPAATADAYLVNEDTTLTV